MLVLGDPLANGRTSHLLPALLPFIRPFLPSLFLRPPLLASPFVFFSHPSRGRLSRGLARPITGCPPIHLFLPFSLFFSPFSLPPFFFPSSNLRDLHASHCRQIEKENSSKRFSFRLPKFVNVSFSRRSLDYSVDASFSLETSGI